MAQPSVSIVVPMYNTGKYLGKCVDSLRCQTLTSIEIILIDDESPDDCQQLARQYEEIDARVHLVIRKNGGLGAARNSGIEAASGEYIAFIDSDDWAEPDMMEKLYVAAKRYNSDVCLTGMKRISDRKVLSVYTNPFAGKQFTGKEISTLRKEMYGPADGNNAPLISVSVCCGLYKRSFLNREELRFTTLKSEDALFNIEVFMCAGAVTCEAGSPYCYRREGQPSISNSFDNTMVEHFENRYRAQLSLANSEPEDIAVECVDRTYKWGFGIARTLIGRIVRLNGTNKEDAVRAICRQAFVRESLAGIDSASLPLKQNIYFYLLQRERCKLLILLTHLNQIIREID